MQLKAILIPANFRLDNTINCAVKMYKWKDITLESEFNEYEPCLKSAKKKISIEPRLKSWIIEYNFRSAIKPIWAASQI